MSTGSQRPVNWPLKDRQENLVLTLPLPPSINHQYATVNGRRLLSVVGRRYKAEVCHHVLLAISKRSDRRVLFSDLHADWALTIRFFFASPLRRDIDGGLKIAQDAICEALGLNDNRITEIHLYKHRDKTNPRMELHLARS